MTNISFTYWRETDGKYLGYLNEYSDHWTQGNDFDDLKDHLQDLFYLLSSEGIPGIKRAFRHKVLGWQQPPHGPDPDPVLPHGRRKAKGHPPVCW